MEWKTVLEQKALNTIRKVHVSGSELELNLGNVL